MPSSTTSATPTPLSKVTEHGQPLASEQETADAEFRTSNRSVHMDVIAVKIQQFTLTDSGRVPAPRRRQSLYGCQIVEGCRGCRGCCSSDAGVHSKEEKM